MKVCVVGAGPAGLTTIKQLRDEGHDVVCFEKSADVGGIWYRHDGDDDEPKAYDNLMLTISMGLMSFSDFPVANRRFADRKGYLQYLHAYADEFGLRKFVRLNTRVDRIKKIGNDEWRVEVCQGGARTEHIFGAVAVCSGPFRHPDMDVSHLKEFSGEVVHSSRYRNNDDYRGKKVLVVGLAESGADVLREISDVSSECTLSIRSRTFLLPRLLSGKLSTDEITVRGLHYELWCRAMDLPFPMKAIFEDETYPREDFVAATRIYGMMAIAASALVNESAKPSVDGPESINNLGQPMLPLKLDLFTEYTKQHLDLIDEWNVKSHEGKGNYSSRAIYCKNVSFIPNIATGKIQVNDSGIKVIRGKTVHFSDGSVKDFDAIVLCTGFKADFSFLDDLRVADNNVRNLYKHAFHPDCDGRFALIGFVRPFSGGIPICAEMQARYFALLCSNKIQLPVDVNKRIEDEKVFEETLTEFSPRHYDAIPSQIFFLDSIAKEIGCLPTAAELVKQPALLAKLWFCTFNQACYRLVGPHSTPDSAYKAVMSEQLPGKSCARTAALIASTIMPSHEHPKDVTVSEFAAIAPLVGEAGTDAKAAEAMYVKALEQIASGYVKP